MRQHDQYLLTYTWLNVALNQRRSTADGFDSGDLGRPRLLISGQRRAAAVS